MVEKAAADVSLPPDRVQTRLVRGGDPADTLLANSTDAELLVVGTNGAGAFTSALLGSVSARCLHHARLPVVVVR